MKFFDCMGIVRCSEISEHPIYMFRLFFAEDLKDCLKQYEEEYGFLPNKVEERDIRTVVYEDGQECYKVHPLYK